MRLFKEILESPDPEALLGSGNEQDRSREVRHMFASIARRYDFLNHLLSANMDRRWRRTCVDVVRERSGGKITRILDVGCGTADLSLAFTGDGMVFGCDFCHPMLVLGQRKIRDAGMWDRVHLTEGDALALPFADGSFDAVVSAFVVRNLANMERGLSEMRRILRTGGVIAMMDFGWPKSALVGSAYRLYFTRILPAMGRLVSGVSGPYKYLPASVQTFPSIEEMKRRIQAFGFRDVECRSLTGGIAVIFVAQAGK